MRQVYLVVEGRTEQAFVHDVLAPHLATFRVSVAARVLGRPGHKGGRVSWVRASSDIRLLLRQFRDPRVVVSTMLDFYALGSDFPGVDVTGVSGCPRTRVVAVEAAVVHAVGDNRFRAHLQLHEFEALLLADTTPLGEFYGDHAAASRLADSLADQAPEAVDGGPATSPSHRIEMFFPRYSRDKTTVGPLCAHDIGLERLRTACPHFGEWLAWLESLGGL